ncbi:unnamed protein product [Parajaminaea phylloscopi]
MARQTQPRRKSKTRLRIQVDDNRSDSPALRTARPTATSKASKEGQTQVASQAATSAAEGSRGRRDSVKTPTSHRGSPRSRTSPSSGPSDLHGGDLASSSVTLYASDHTAASQQDSVSSEGRPARKPRKSTPGSHAKKRAPGHIPRPRNAFILFRSHAVRTGLVPKDMERDHRNISRIVSLMWNSLSESDRETWQQEAQKEKEQHALLYPDYKYRPGAPKQAKAKRDLSQPEQVEEKCENVADMILKMYGEQGLIRDGNGQTLSRSERFRRERHQAHQQKLATRGLQESLEGDQSTPPRPPRRRARPKNVTVAAQAEAGPSEQWDVSIKLSPSLTHQLPQPPPGRRRSLAGDLATSIHGHHAANEVLLPAQVFDEGPSSSANLNRRASSVPPLDDMPPQAGAVGYHDPLLEGPDRLSGFLTLRNDPMAFRRSVDHGLPGNAALLRGPSAPLSGMPAPATWDPRRREVHRDEGLSQFNNGRGIGGRGLRKEAPPPFNFPQFWPPARHHPAIASAQMSPMSHAASMQGHGSSFVDLHGPQRLQSPSLQRRRTIEVETPRASTFEAAMGTASWMSQQATNDVTLLSPLKSASFGSRRASAAWSNWSRLNAHPVALQSPSHGRRMSLVPYSPSRPPAYSALYPPPTPFGQFSFASMEAPPIMAPSGTEATLAALVSRLTDIAHPRPPNALPLHPDQQQHEHEHAHPPGPPPAGGIGGAPLHADHVQPSIDDGIFQFSPDFLLDVHDDAPARRLASSAGSTAPALSQPPSTAAESLASPVPSLDATHPTEAMSLPILHSALDRTDVMAHRTHSASVAPKPSEGATSTHDSHDMPARGPASMPREEEVDTKPASIRQLWPEQDDFSRGISQRLLQTWIQNYRKDHASQHGGPGEAHSTDDVLMSDVSMDPASDADATGETLPLRSFHNVPHGYSSAMEYASALEGPFGAASVKYPHSESGLDMVRSGLNSSKVASPGLSASPPIAGRLECSGVPAYHPSSLVSPILLSASAPGGEPSSCPLTTLKGLPGHAAASPTTKSVRGGSGAKSSRSYGQRSTSPPSPRTTASGKKRDEGVKAGGGKLKTGPKAKSAFLGADHRKASPPMQKGVVQQTVNLTAVPRY